MERAERPPPILAARQVMHVVTALQGSLPAPAVVGQPRGADVSTQGCPCLDNAGLLLVVAYEAAPIRLAGSHTRSEASDADIAAWEPQDTAAAGTSRGLRTAHTASKTRPVPPARVVSYVDARWAQGAAVRAPVTAAAYKGRSPLHSGQDGAVRRRLGTTSRDARRRSAVSVLGPAGRLPARHDAQATVEDVVFGAILAPVPIAVPSGAGALTPTHAAAAAIEDGVLIATTRQRGLEPAIRLSVAALGAVVTPPDWVLMA